MSLGSSHQQSNNADLTPCIVKEGASGCVQRPMVITPLDGGSEAPQQAWRCGWMVLRRDEAMAVAK